MEEGRGAPAGMGVKAGDADACAVRMCVIDHVSLRSGQIWIENSLVSPITYDQCSPIPGLLSNLEATTTRRVW